MAVAQSPVIPGASVPATHWDGGIAADIFASCMTPALAPFSGTASAYEKPLGGHVVLITANDGTEFYIAHLADAGRANGPVTAGQVVGYVSDSGNAEGRGCHAHVAVGQIQSDGSGTIRPIDFFSGSGGGGDSGSPPGVPVGLWIAAGALGVAWYVFG